MTTVHDSPTAAGSGANASSNFKDRARDTADVSPERVSTVVTAVLHGVHAAIRDNQVTYPEFQAAKAWLMAVGEGGEWPLFMDVFVEHVVEEVAASSQRGTLGTIEGPYYLPSQVQLNADCELPHREDEKGTPLVLRGQVRDLDGTPLAGAEVDIWHADADGYYSGFAPGVPDGNLRGVVTTDADGNFSIRTVQPAPYQIPTDGPTGKLIEAAGWHPWRPAHLHIMVRADGHRTITTQLYFAGGDWLDSDVAEATKPDLILDPVDDGTGVREATYDFELEGN
ncbi:catechol 1,2-dioxygenase [Kribbella speibonae]|uniref:Catechol 1,2-dioxygenase n=1 Tax=Kribbella speibonae TaxID=1572660 RepID=A0A4R0IRM5_9ACTN|nr:catechol 1,2-dioxygenase [Kribbella speibonae]TCC27368.1 catechol 1,2-dioxygenase [Kribbella speibonae]TCC35769.1 catechol 1,2-dioxygenase [Kribbella speibonae]